MGAADVTFDFDLELKKRSSSATILDKNSCTFNWIPWTHAAADMQLIRGKHARLVAVIPPNRLVLHSSSCWSDAKCDETSSKYATQI